MSHRENKVNNILTDCSVCMKHSAETALSHSVYLKKVFFDSTGSIISAELTGCEGGRD